MFLHRVASLIGYEEGVALWSLVSSVFALALQTRAPLGIIDANLHPKQIVFGTAYACGPVWLPDGSLMFSDLNQSEVYKISKDRKVKIGYPPHREFGHTIDLHGQVVTCLKDTRSVGRKSNSGTYSHLATTYDGKRLNGPTDLAIKSDGSIYFTDPKTIDPTSKPEMDFSGVYRIAPDGKLQLLTKDLAFPNGVAFSNDEKKLYISDTIRQCVRVFDVLPDGNLTNSQVFGYLMGDNAGAPGGIKLDEKGNVYCAGPGGVLVFEPGGKYLGLIYVKDAVTNLCFGDRDYKTLYITAVHGVYKIRVKIPGHPIYPFSKTSK